MSHMWLLLCSCRLTVETLDPYEAQVRITALTCPVGLEDYRPSSCR